VILLATMFLPILLAAASASGTRITIAPAGGGPATSLVLAAGRYAIDVFPSGDVSLEAVPAGDDPAPPPVPDPDPVPTPTPTPTPKPTPQSGLRVAARAYREAVAAAVREAAAGVRAVPPAVANQEAAVALVKARREAAAQGFGAALDTATRDLRDATGRIVDPAAYAARLLEAAEEL
jgi:hypothetical protein